MTLRSAFDWVNRAWDGMSHLVAEHCVGAWHELTAGSIRPHFDLGGEVLLVAFL